MSWGKAYKTDYDRGMWGGSNTLFILGGAPLVAIHAMLTDLLPGYRENGYALMAFKNLFGRPTLAGPRPDIMVELRAKDGERVTHTLPRAVVEAWLDGRYHDDWRRGFTPHR